MDTGIDVAATTAHICRRIRETPVTREPWPHQVVENFLPADVFARLLASVPEDWLRTNVDAPRTWVMPGGDGIMVYKKGARARSWDRRRGALGVLADIFSAINDERALFDALKKPFSPELKGGLTRFQDRYATPLKVRQLTRLTKDSSTYELNPHTDAPNKLVSIIHYGRCDPGAKLGTILYEPKQSGFGCWGMTFHDFSAFREAAAMPFVANSAFIFVRDDCTFHGVRFEPAAGDFARITIQSNFWMSDPEASLQLRAAPTPASSL